MNRVRQNTDVELQIVDISERTNIRIGNPSCKQTLEDLLYRIVYYKYAWNIFMGFIFLILRIITVTNKINKLSLTEWYADTFMFILVNNYMFKRLHWNNNNDSYFNTNFKYIILAWFTFCLVFFSIINICSPSFYIAKNSSIFFNIPNVILFSLIIFYVIINQAYTIHFLYHCNDYKVLLCKQMIKYGLLTIYLCLDKIIYNVGLTDEPYESLINLNQYHIHHWFFGLILIILTELPQVYYSFFQYLHFVIYLHGVAVYSYDTILH